MKPTHQRTSNYIWFWRTTWILTTIQLELSHVSKWKQYWTQGVTGSLTGLKLRKSRKSHRILPQDKTKFRKLKLQRPYYTKKTLSGNPSLFRWKSVSTNYVCWFISENLLIFGNRTNTILQRFSCCALFLLEMMLSWIYPLRKLTGEWSLRSGSCAILRCNSRW